MDSDSDEEEFRLRRQKMLSENFADLGLDSDTLLALSAHLNTRSEEPPPPVPIPATVSSPPAKKDFDCSNGRTLAPKNADYKEKEYWEERFAMEEDYDWLLTYHDFEHHLVPVLDESCAHLATATATMTPTASEGSPKSEQRPPSSSPCRSLPKILVLGCGNSTFSSDLYDAGFTNIVNIDFSAVVIEKMRVKHSALRPRMTWLVMDMLNMSAFGAEEFDVVIDKATMDALMVSIVDPWQPGEQALSEADTFCKEVNRVLKVGRKRGVFVSVSFAQPHFRTKFLMRTHASSSPYQPTTRGECAEYGWDLSYDTIQPPAPAPAPATKGKSKGSLESFFYTMRRL
jgi:EEF1A lysine methyltransferase 4